ncbi:MAG: hypothetical protein KGZ50_01425 [Peptococcaceae bacterium]|nr:hypothetical protein [Peptococcaceae bacterium]
MTGRDRVRTHVKIRGETYSALKHLADLNKEPVAGLMRRLLVQELGTSAVEADALSLMVRKAIRDTLKPVEEALMKQAAEAAITAATGMYLGVQAAHDLGVNNALEIHDRACEMAVDYVGGRKDLPI